MDIFKLFLQILILLFTSNFSYEASFLGNVSSVRKFIQNRNEFFRREKRRQLGGNIRLNAKENAVNNILMQAKRSEIDRFFSTGQPFPPAMHFFRAKPLIDESDVFKIIRKMPKGGNLHTHDATFVNVSWLVQNVTYRNNPLYFCQDKDGSISYQYFVRGDPPVNPECPWKSLREERARSGNVDMFDNMIYNSLSLVVDNPEEAYPNGGAVWAKFGKVLGNTNRLISLKSVFTDYFYQGLTEFLEDNVQYIEMRARLQQVVDLDGRTFNHMEVLQLYKDVADQFVRENPGFMGVKIIFAGLRIFTNEEVLRDVKTSIRFLQQFPTFFAGYDMLFDEDRARPLIEYANELLFPRRLNPPIKLPYFFHAGATTWQGLRADKNMVDAVLLNTTRLGHGFTLIKHPLVQRLVRKCDIAIEIQPISNQVLVVIQDQRDHPASSLIARGFPIVIGSDGRAAWNSKPMSHDFYIVFMGHTGRDDDIKVLKQLAIHSIRYSSLSDLEKRKAFRLWNRKWNDFLDEMLATTRKRRRY